MTQEHGEQPDPSRVSDISGFVEALGRLRVWAGNPSYRVLAKKVGPLLRPPRTLSHTTLAGVFQPSRRRLDLDLVVATVRALVPDDAEVDRWRAAWYRVHAEAKTGGSVSVLRQLPADLATFTGRVAQLAALTAALGHTGSGVATVSVRAIEGMAGVGKTQLAVHAAHQMVRAGRFADAQLYVNLHGFDPLYPPSDPAEVLEGFLRALGVPGQFIPAGREQRSAMFRDRLDQRDALVVLDNAAGEDQVSDLIPASPGCLVLITSRRSLAGLDGCEPLVLEAFTDAEAVSLLAAVAGGERVGAEQEAAERVAQLCGRLPLALALAAARLRSRPRWLLEDLAARLDRDGLEAVSAGGRSLSPIFDLSHAALTEPAKRMFHLAALHPGEDFTAEAAASLAGVDAATGQEMLGVLQDEHLVHARTRDRYEIHDLLRRYAVEHAAGYSLPIRRATQARVVEHYLHTAHHAAFLQFPGRDPSLIPLGTARVAITPLADAAAAGRWFEAELSVICGLIASPSTSPTATWQLAWTLVGHLTKTSRVRELIETQTLALHAAEELGHIGAQAYALDRTSWARSEAHDHDGAEADARRAIEIYRALGDRVYEARQLCTLGLVLSARGDHASCLEQARAALQLSRALSNGDRRTEARSLNLIGWSMAHLGDAKGAVTFCRQALQLFEEAGDVWGRATALDSLAYAHQELQNYAEAVSTYRRALDLRVEFEAPAQRAWTLLALGDLYRQLDDVVAAKEAFREALALAEKIASPLSSSARQRLACL